MILLALPLATLALLLQPHARRLHHQHQQRLQPTVDARSGRIACGVVYDLCVQRLGATEAEADKAEGKLLQTTLNILGDGRRKIVLLLPAVLSLSIESNVLPSLAALQDRLGLSEAELTKIVLRLPQVLSYSIESNVLPSLAALQDRLGLSEAELKKIVLRQPTVLSLSIESNILPKIDWLQHDLGLSSDELRARLLTQPAMLTYSLEKRFKPRVDLCRSLGLDATSMLFSYISYAPSEFEEYCEKKLKASRAGRGPGS